MYLYSLMRVSSSYKSSFLSNFTITLLYHTILNLSFYHTIHTLSIFVVKSLSTVCLSPFYLLKYIFLVPFIHTQYSHSHIISNQITSSQPCDHDFIVTQLSMLLHSYNHSYPIDQLHSIFHFCFGNTFLPFISWLLVSKSSHE